MFSHPTACFFIVSYVVNYFNYFLPSSNISMLINSSLSLISFIDHDFIIISKNHHHIPMSSRILLCYLTKVLLLCMLYVIYYPFQVGFGEGYKICAQIYLFLPIGVQVFQHHLLIKLSLNHHITLTSFSKIS